jgi:hypothetical protein
MPRSKFKALVVMAIVLIITLVIVHYVRLELPDPDKILEEKRIIADMVILCIYCCLYSTVYFFSIL